MLKKKIIFYLSIFLLVASCGSWDSVKRGLTGAKKESADEFLVKKKDPLTLPPDFENLPSPEDAEITKEAASFEKKLHIFTTCFPCFKNCEQNICYYSDASYYSDT